MAYSKKTGSSGKASMSRKYGAKTGKRRAAPFGRVSPGLTKAVKAVVARQAETKYCAQEQQLNAIVQQQILMPPSLFSMIPPCSEGVGPSARIGDKVRNAHGYTDFSFTINGNSVGPSSWGIKIFHLEHRSIKDSTLFAPLTAQIAGTLLDQGNNATTDWNPAVIDPQQLSQMPVSDSNWVVKGIKTLYLSKNEGTINGPAVGAGFSPNSGTDKTHASCRMYWKRSANIHYETATGAPNPTLPTDYAPVYATVAWQTDGPYVPSVNSLVLVSTRSHMWYQDS